VGRQVRDQPGETRFDLNYSVPYTAGTAYAGKIASPDENTYLVAPEGVTLEAPACRIWVRNPARTRTYSASRQRLSH